MLEQITNKITPEQENVYYSIKSLRDTLTGLVDASQLEAIVLQTKKFYLPVFVLDTTDVTNIIIDVYQRPYVTNLESTITITPTSVSLSEPAATPTNTTPVPDDKVDNAISLELLNSFHSENNVTETTWKTNSDTVDQRKVEIIASTKSWYDKELFADKKLNSKIFVNLVKETLKNLPSKTLEKYQKSYQDVEEEIDALLQLLSDAKDVKELSVDKLKTGSLLATIYDTNSDTEFAQQYLQELITQAFYDLYDIENHIGQTHVNTQKRGIDPATNVPIFTLKPIEVTGASVTEIGFRAVWHGILSQVTRLEKRNISPVEVDSNTYIRDLLEVNSRSVFRGDSVLNEWFESNLFKKISGKEASFASLDDYTTTFKSKTSEAFSYFESEGGAGSAVLLEQAVYKAILEICESNINVTSYSAKKSDGTNIFSAYDRNGVLGPNKCYPFPSPPVENRTQPIVGSIGTFSLLSPTVASVGSIASGSSTSVTGPVMQNTVSASVQATNAQNSGKVISSFSKNGFLCFHPLVQELKEILSMPADVQNWLIENLVTTTSSNHEIARLILNTYLASESQGTSEEMTNAFHNYDTGDSIVGSEGNNWAVFSRPGITTFYETSERPGSYFQWHAKGGSVVSTTSSTGASGNDFGILSPPINSSVGDLSDLHYGWSSSESSDNDIGLFYNNKLYNLPNLLNTTIAITRAVVHKTIENLIQTYRSITSNDVDINHADVLNAMSVDAKGDLLSGIATLVENIIENNSGSINLVLNFDGTKSVIWSGSNPTGNAYQTSNSYKDTVGKTALSTVCSDYVQFISKISSNSYVKLVAEPTRKLVPVSDYIPSEAIASQSNTNFEQDWGQTNQYFNKDTVQSTWDLLEFTEEEFTKNILLKKEASAVKGNESSTKSWNVGKEFLDRYSIFYKHVNLLTNFTHSLETFVNDVNMIQPNDKITKLYEKGILDETYSLSDPKNTTRQIISKRKEYSCDTDGIARRIESAIFNLPDADKVQEADLIFVIGLPHDLWIDENRIALVPYFYSFDSTPDSAGIQMLDSDGAPIKIHVSYSSNTIEGKEWLNYLHIIRGIDIGPHSFSSKGMPIYEEDIVKNDAGIFNWTKEDFIDQIPILPLDTMWNMSPWLFPRNYFHDVVEDSKYHKIVVCTISKATVKEFGTGNIYFNQNPNNLIGSIQWQVQYDN